MSEQVRPYPADPAAMTDAEFEAEYGAHYPPLPYHQLLRAGRRGVWRPILGIALLALTMVLVAPLVWLVPFLGWQIVAGNDWIAWLDGLATLRDPTPSMLAYLLVTLASLIPATFLVVRVLHGVRPRWLTSVAPRMRWGYFAVCVLASALVLFVTVLLSALLPSTGVTPETDAGLNAFTATTAAFLLVVVLVVPLQAAGEEYLFRGYLTQALGGVFGATWVAVLVPATLFAIAHGSQSVPVFFDRFAFGVVAGLLVVWTGGLEAAIAMHVLNNLVAFGFALAFGDMGSTLVPTGGTWWMIPVTLTQSLLYLGAAVWIARRMGLATHATGRALVASQRRV